MKPQLLFGLLLISFLCGNAEAACTWSFKSKARILLGQDPLVTVNHDGEILDCAYKLKGPGADGRQVNECHAGNQIYLLERERGGGLRHPTGRKL